MLVPNWKLEIKACGTAAALVFLVWAAQFAPGRWATLAQVVLAAIPVGALAFLITWALARRRDRKERDLLAAFPRCKHGVNKVRGPKCESCRKEVETEFADKNPWVYDRNPKGDVHGYGKGVLEDVYPPWFARNEIQEKIIKAIIGEPGDKSNEMKAAWDTATPKIEVHVTVQGTKVSPMKHIRYATLQATIHSNQREAYSAACGRELKEIDAAAMWVMTGEESSNGPAYGDINITRTYQEDPHFSDKPNAWKGEWRQFQDKEPPPEAPKCARCGHEYSEGDVMDRHESALGTEYSCYPSCKPAPKFKAGQWVRSLQYGLCRVTGNRRQWFPTLVDAANKEQQASESSLEPAIPRRGEWWQWTTDYATTKEPFLWTETELDFSKFVAQGALVPVNFGKGNG